MKNQICKVSGFVFLLLTLLGCRSFFEEDISNQEVDLLSPAQGLKTEIVSQTFWWQKIDGATNYRLQIVTPSFDSSEVLILDTLVAGDKFSQALFPSVFEWRVRAENSVFQTKWSKGLFYILSTDDLTRQMVNLMAPGSLTNSKNIRFEWDYLYNATNYSFVAYKEEWDGVIEISPTLVDTTFLEKVLPDGAYFWGVKAKNSLSETIYSKKNLIVDSTPPSKPVLVAPVDGLKTTNLTMSFEWSSSDLTSGIAYDSVKVYSDKNLTALVMSSVSDTRGAELTFTDRETYFWTVRSVDKAGSPGPVSSTYSFIIN